MAWRGVVGLALGGALGCGARSDLGDARSRTALTPNSTRLIAAGAEHSCATSLAGGMKCWGSNAHGQLGDGTTASASAPVPVALPQGGAITAIAAGYDHGCAYVLPGRVYCWGRNDQGQASPDRAGSDVLAPVEVPLAGAGDGGVTALAASWSCSCAGFRDGRIRCWGGNDAGCELEATQFDAPAKALIAGYQHFCALLADERLFCWGRNGDGELADGTSKNRTRPVQVLDHVRLVASRELVTLAVRDRSDGYATIVAWGAFGTLYDGPAHGSAPLFDAHLVESVAVGAEHACAAYGTTPASPPVEILCWGNNTWGQLGNGTYVPHPSPRPTGFGGEPIAPMVAGPQHTCAVVAGGVACWGRNSAGQCGQPASTDVDEPAWIPGL